MVTGGIQPKTRLVQGQRYSCLDSLQAGCQELMPQKYGQPCSRYIAARIKSGYFSPEDYYEALMHRLVTADSSWLDVGCGRAPFPNNLSLSAELSKRCQRLVGIDPDSAVIDNPFVHEHYNSGLEEYDKQAAFDLVTARMVVEHVSRPAEFTAALSRVTIPGSIVVIFTVNFWSLTTLAARFSPMSAHLLAKRWLWGTEDKDTFPTVYKMNQRCELRELMTSAGFEERMFLVLPDASICWRIAVLRYAELACWKTMRLLKIPYFDTCVLGVYQRVNDAGKAAMNGDIVPPEQLTD